MLLRIILSNWLFLPNINICANEFKDINNNNNENNLFIVKEFLIVNYYLGITNLSKGMTACIALEL